MGNFRIFFTIFVMINAFLHVTCSDFMESDIRNLKDDCAEEEINEQRIVEERFRQYKRLFFDHDNDNSHVTIENIQEIDLRPQVCSHQDKEPECKICEKIGSALAVYNADMVNRYIFDKEYQNKDMIRMILDCDVIGFSSENLFDNNLNFFLSMDQINKTDDLAPLWPIFSISSLIILRELINKNQVSIDELTEYLSHYTPAKCCISILFDRDNFVQNVKTWVKDKRKHLRENTQLDEQNTIKNHPLTKKINNDSPPTKKVRNLLLLSVLVGLGMYDYKTHKIRSKLNQHRKALFIGGIGLALFGVYKYFSRPCIEIIKEWHRTSKEKRERKEIISLLRPGNDSRNVILCCETRDSKIGAPMGTYILKQTNNTPYPQLAHACFFALFNEKMNVSDFRTKKITLSDFEKNSHTFFLNKETNRILYRVVILEAKKIINTFRKKNQKHTLYINEELAYDFLHHHEQNNPNSLLDREYACITKDENEEVTGECMIKFIAVNDKRYKLAVDGSFPFSAVL